MADTGKGDDVQSLGIVQATQTTETLLDRVEQTLAVSESADPHEIARSLRFTLSAEEEEMLIMDGLGGLVRWSIRRRRADRTHAQAQDPTPQVQGCGIQRMSGGHIEWPADDVLADLVGSGSFDDAARKLGVGRQSLKRRCHARGIKDSNDRMAERCEQDLWSKMAQITKEFADGVRADGIRIGLEQANAERVCVAGVWKFLADCTAGDLRTLANEHTARAVSNAARGAYYLAIADQVEAGGFVDVRAMCEAESRQPA